MSLVLLTYSKLSDCKFQRKKRQYSLYTVFIYISFEIYSQAMERFEQSIIKSNTILKSCRVVPFYNLPPRHLPQAGPDCMTFMCCIKVRLFILHLINVFVLFPIGYDLSVH